MMKQRPRNLTLTQPSRPAVLKSKNKKTSGETRLSGF